MIKPKMKSKTSVQSGVQDSNASLSSFVPSVEPNPSSKKGLYVLLVVFGIIALCLGVIVAYLLIYRNTGDDCFDDGVISHTCTYDGTTYDSGESFPSTDGCNTCSCTDGEVLCTEMACDTSAAESCVYEGVSYTEGEVVYLTEDGCNVCTCQNNDVKCTNNLCEEETYEDDYFSLNIPEGWTYLPVESGSSEGVKVTSGDLFVYVLSTEGSAGGAVGGRMSDVTSLLIGWMHDGANCLPTDADIGSGYIGTSTAIHTLSVSNSSPAYVFEACGLDVSRTYFLGGYVNNLEAGGFFIDPEYLLGTPSSSASRLFLIVYGYSADTASGLPTAEDVVVDELIDDVSVIVGLIRVK